MLVETVIATLALGRIGAIFTPIFSGYGAPAVAARLRDCEASVLVTADGFLRRGSVVPMKAIADEAVALAPSIGRVIVVRRLGDAGAGTAVGPGARPLVGRIDGCGAGPARMKARPAAAVAGARTPRRRTC